MSSAGATRSLAQSSTPSVSSRTWIDRARVSRASPQEQVGHHPGHVDAPTLPQKARATPPVATARRTPQWDAARGTITCVSSASTARLGCLVMRHTAVKITSFKRPALIILQLQGDGRHGQAPTEQRDERSPRGHKQDPRQDGTQQGAARPAEQHPLPAGPRPEPRVVHPRLVREELLECGRLEVGTTNWAANFAHQQRRDELGRPCIVHGSELPLWTHS